MLAYHLSPQQPESADKFHKIPEKIENLVAQKEKYTAGSQISMGSCWKVRYGASFVPVWT